MTQKPASSLYVRLVTAVVLLPFVLVLVLVPLLRPVFVMAVAGLVLLGLREYYALARALGHQTAGITGGFVGLLIMLSAGFAPSAVTPLLVFGALALCIAHLWRGHHGLGAVAASVFGVVYVPWFAAHVLMVHGIGPSGPGLTLLLLATIIASDTGAYFAGKGFGRHKLAPRTSPNKTWEGALGGMIAGLAAGAILYAIDRETGLAPQFPGWPLPAYLAAAAVFAALGQLGDLVESMLKRDAGVKDAGALFPGHGGVLDRCDGFLFAAPALYYIALGMGEF
jgi:phosphatidate cytidylyltransferase